MQPTDLLFFGGIFAIMFFMIIRPKIKEQKETQKMLNALKKGDKVVTTAGLHGEVSAVKDNIVSLKVAENVKLDFDKTAIARSLAPAAGEK